MVNLALKQYQELYSNDKARAMNVFTRDLEERMKKLLVIIENKANDELVNSVEEMLMRDWCKEAGLDVPKLSPKRTLFPSELRNRLTGQMLQILNVFVNWMKKYEAILPR